MDLDTDFDAYIYIYVYMYIYIYIKISVYIYMEKGIERCTNIHINWGVVKDIVLLPVVFICC